MRILICYPWLNLGGAPNTSITLARGLKELGHDVYFFSKSNEIFDERFRRSGITCISAPHHSILPKLNHLNLKAYRMLCDVLDRYSIDIIHAFHYHSYLLALFAAARRDIPVIFTGVWFLGVKYFPVYPGRVIFVAKEFKDYDRKLFRNHPHEVIILPNRVDLDEFNPNVDHSSFSAEMKLPVTGWKIAFMSRIDTNKIGSIRNAIDAMSILALRGRNIYLAIAGEGRLFNDAKKMCEDANRDCGREVVRLLGGITETSRFLAWSDIVLGIGRSAVEGMASGRPTLIVGENGLAGTVDPEQVALLQYHNFAGRNAKTPIAPVHLADAIEEIMNNRPRYEQLAAFARKYAIDNYDYRVGARRLEKIYTDSLDDPPLNRLAKMRLRWTNLLMGYGGQYLLVLRMKIREILGRDTS
ncbi:MAG: glycosyltransferase family 4 protein [bacterium]|nr:MAG: glycosyltransferase family 4 protein [bacterium]